MIIRKAELNDINDILKIIHEAQEYFKEHHIPQWQNGYPDYSQFVKDIEENGSYVLVDNNKIIGTCFISFKEDPYYKNIENGKWLNDEQYAVIHRIAIDNDYKGKNIAKLFFDYAYDLCQERNIHNIKVDTHKLNLSMQKTLKKNGFIKCGDIHIQDNAPRIGFQKCIK